MSTTEHWTLVPAWLTDSVNEQSSLSLVTAFMALNVRTFPHDEGGSVEWGFTFASSRIGKQTPLFAMNINSVLLGSAKCVRFQWHTPSPSPRRFGCWLCSSTQWETFTTWSRISSPRSRGTIMSSVGARLEVNRMSSLTIARDNGIQLKKICECWELIHRARVSGESGE